MRVDEVPAIWRGLQKLEHVAITLGADANAQQIFESLNSTGEPLRDHELIHNYVLMGLSHAEQSEIEDSFWLPIEQNTGEAIAAFWRHYLVMTTGREVAVAGERGVYDAFRQQFPRLDLDDAARARRRVARVLGRLPCRCSIRALEPDPEVARQLGYLNTFGRGMYPLVMRAYLDYPRGVARRRRADRARSEQLQSLLLRRTIVGVGNDRLVARLCRARAEGPRRAGARDRPHHPVRRARAGGAEVRRAAARGLRARRGSATASTSADGLDVEHVFPLAPGDSWSGDGDPRVGRLQRRRAEQPPRSAADRSATWRCSRSPWPSARRRVVPRQARRSYARSAMPLTRELADGAAWGTAAIAERTVRADRPSSSRSGRGRPPCSSTTTGSRPILDAKRRRGWPRGWEREFDYVEYRGEHWEVYDVKYLFNRIFKRLWADSASRRRGVQRTPRRPDLRGAQRGTATGTRSTTSHFLYMGWDSKYMLTAVQGLLDEAGIAAEVFVKYSYIGAVM